MKISQAFNEYIRDYLILRGSHKYRIIHFRSCSKLFVEIVGDKDLSDITYEDVSLWISKLRVTGNPKSINTTSDYVCSLRSMFKYWKLRGERVIEYSLIPVPKREIRTPSFLSPEEVDRMIDSTLYVRNKAIIATLYGSGLRVSELRSLNVDILENDSFMVIGKGSKPRVCFLDERSRNYLKLYVDSRKDSSNALITTKMGNRMSVHTIQLIVENAREKADIAKKVTPHTLRHSFATNYMRNNGNIRTLATLLGHSSIETTTIYTHIVDEDLRREYMRYHTC